MQLTLQEAAVRLGKSVRQVRYLINSGQISAQKLGGRWFVQSSDLPLSQGQNALLNAVKEPSELQWKKHWAWGRRKRGSGVTPSGSA